MPYARLAPADLPVTMADQNVESEIYRLARVRGTSPIRRLLASVEERKLRRAESSRLPAFDRVFVLTPEDAEILRRLGVERITVLPMPAPDSLGATPESSGRAADHLRGVHELVRSRGRIAVVSRSGAAACPGARAGRGVGAGRAARAGRDPTTRPRSRGFASRGTFEEVAPHAARARVEIVPLRIAGGVRMKLLDCLAWGLPAVSTSVGARGLEFPEGCRLLQAG